MGIIVAIEGADGVGKNTTSRLLCETLQAAGKRATVIGFPRYGETVAGVTIGRYLAGDMPVPVSPHAAATLYALDRFEWRDAILAAVAAHDVLIFDRYVASNMAYQGARVPPEESRALMEWILALETGQFALPAPALSIYLDTPWDLARTLILQKAERSYTAKSFDEYEADVALQQRVRANYESIVGANLLGPWQIVHASAEGTMRAPGDIVGDILDHIAKLPE
ncbi:thymidylate kinase [Sphingomonas sp. HITSZ_GF]|uniref:thymidylate kinase n=1 Tax=Sphingomonas sp. HITSZ_GF TaxID=3037247 RepID=UPI00240D42A4|nr:thymidylate kinase [Sphingomonas sp. HITSZ_GF]MDG2534055.1 thymidylate kinase [Sphingomonas sp. HITSZ_GF]